MIVRELITRLGFSIDDAKLKNYEARAQRATESFSAMSGVFGAVVAGMAAVGIGQITKISDEWSNMEARIGNTTKSAEEQAAVMDQIYEISNRTRQETTATGDLYTKLARNAGDLGATKEDLLSVTETVNQALVAGGASTAEAKSTILQLGQALGSGRLQGDELRSLGENADILMIEIAKYFNVSKGELKQMGAEGKLTSKEVFKAILQGRSAVEKQFGNMPITIGQAITTVGNRFGRFLQKINKETGIFKYAANAIFYGAEWIEKKLDALAKSAGGWGNLMKYVGMGIAAIFAGPLVHGIRFATMAMLNFFKTALLNPWTWVLLGIILLLDDLYTWIQGGDSIIGDFLGSFEDFKASDTFAMLMDSLQALYELGQAVFPDLQELGDSAFTLIKDVAVSVFGIIANLVMVLVKLFSGDFQGAINSLGNAIDIWGNGVMKVLGDVWAIAKGVISTLASFAGATINLSARGGVSAQSLAVGGGGAPQVVVENNVNVAGVPNASVSTQTDTSVGGGPSVTDYDFTGGD